MPNKLIRYEYITEDAYDEYISEWELSKDRIVPFAARRAQQSFDDVMKRWIYDESDEVYNTGFVPSTLYFMIDEKGRILGAIHLRHVLNERLRLNGGHIGYGVRASERKKGYASEMLALLLAELKGKYEKVMVTCDDVNINSAKTIEKNGGILEDKVVFEGELTRRYWIQLEDQKMRLETERTIMRKFELSDLEDFYAYCINPEVGPNAGWKPHESKEESLKYLKMMMEGDEVLAIVDKASEKVIGSIGMHEDTMRNTPDVKMIGYVLAKEFWGKGLMTEAVREVMRHGFEEEKLKLISVQHFANNDKSRRVIEKIGFKSEGTIRYARKLYDDSIEDLVCYSMTREEWKQL
ncbi:GNAT family N-acetyltransferase [Fusibacter bizertensis]